jgi:hypothetical protein
MLEGKVGPGRPRFPRSADPGVFSPTPEPNRSQSTDIDAAALPGASPRTSATSQLPASFPLRPHPLLQAVMNRAALPSLLAFCCPFADGVLP